MKLKPNPKYKDSGISWIGKIPEGWEVKKVKQFSRLFTGSTPDSGNEKYWDGDITWVTPADLSAQQKFIKKSKRTITREGYDNSGTSFVSTGAIILATRAPIGYPTIVGAKLCFNQGCKAIEIKKDFIPDYLYYYLNAYVDVLVSKGNATTFGELSSYDLTSFKVLMPTIQEQTTIANFLDKKTVEIDALIEKDKKLIVLLKEKRTALINHAVTKGFDPNVKLRDSGIPWIGGIPEGWEVKKVKHKYHVIDGDRGKEYPSEEDLKDSGVPFLSAECINDFKLFIARSNYISEEKFHKLGRGKLKDKDIILTVRGTIGKAAVFLVNTYNTGFINAEMMILRRYDDLEHGYMFYIISCDVWQKQVDYHSYGTAQKQLNNSILKNILIPIPSPNEQLQITKYLDKATSKIDKTIEKIEKKIKLLEKYKKSLIHHAVTGKIDVREAVA